MKLSTLLLQIIDYVHFAGQVKDKANPTHIQWSKEFPTFSIQTFNPPHVQMSMEMKYHLSFSN